MRLIVALLMIFSIAGALIAQDIPAPTFSAGGGLTPPLTSIRGATGNLRTLAAVKDSRGHTAMFVENEMLVFSNDPAAVRALAVRWRGQIRSQADLKGDVSGTPMAFLVSIDSSLADPSRLPVDVRKADPLSRGAHIVSSLAGLRTLAAAAYENASGMKAGVNYVFAQHSVYDWTSREGQEPGSTDYIDAFKEPYLCKVNHPLSAAQCMQDIGVTAAWRALSYTQKVGNRVDVAIWDSGFAINPDFPSYSQVSPPGSAGVPGPGTPPFHGTDVAAAGFAVPFNHFGVAGPGGLLTNVHLDLVSSPSFDLFEIIQSLYGYISSLVSRPQILNISAGIDIPSSLCLAVCDAVSLVTNAARLANILVIASAGNEGRNVDDETCIIACWESSKLLPCEFDSVLCVGGLANNATVRHPNSNYGTDSPDPKATNTVRLFAPFQVRVYDEHQPACPPANPCGYLPGDIKDKFGTSFSAPFVAGVASLVLAANPDLSANEVEKILLTTATPSADPTVNRYVNAFAAVRAALGNTGVEPSIQLSSPSLSYRIGQTVTFNAVATEEISLADISSRITWPDYWAPNGTPLTGNTLSLTATAAGSLTVTAQVELQGIRKTASLTVNIEDYPTTVGISSGYQPPPLLTSLPNFQSGSQITFIGNARKNAVDRSGEIVWKYSVPSAGQPAVEFGRGRTATLTQDKVTLPAGLALLRMQIMAEVPGANAQTAVDIFIYPPSMPVPTITAAQQRRPECVRETPALPCLPVVYASRVGVNAAGVPLYQANLMSFAGFAVDEKTHAPIDPSMLSWHIQNLAGSGFAQGSSYIGPIQFVIPPTSPVTGTANNPFQLQIFLQARDAHAGSGYTSVTLKVVIQ